MIIPTPGHPANSANYFSTLPFPGDSKHDLSGMVFSGLQVIGYARSKTTKAGSQWVCRCICGRFEIRRSKPLKNQSPGKNYRCSICEGERNQQRHEEYLRRAAA